MKSLLVCHKERNRFSPSQHPAKKAPFTDLKEEGGLLARPGSTRTKPRRLGLAQRGGLVRRGWLSVFSILAIGFVWLAPPLRAQFARAATDPFLMPTGPNGVQPFDPNPAAPGSLTRQFL